MEGFKLFWALFLSVLGNTIAWFHMNAQFKWDWAKTQWWLILAGIPISYCFFYSTKYFYEYLTYFHKHQIWGHSLRKKPLIHEH